jgi:hypothetical protein
MMLGCSIAPPILFSINITKACPDTELSQDFGKNDIVCKL